MGLKKWMMVVKSRRDGVNFSSRKQDRKQAKRLKKLQNVAAAKHQPIEKVIEEAFCNKKRSKRLRRKAAQMEEERIEKVENHGKAAAREASQTRRGKKRGQSSDDESDSDADLTYEQYLKEVQDKKRKLAMEGSDEKQDDIDIHRYSKLLGIIDGPKAKKPKSFTNDGLDYLLDFCDADARHRILSSSTDHEIALKGSDLSEEEDHMEDEAGSPENLVEDDSSSCKSSNVEHASDSNEDCDFTNNSGKNTDNEETGDGSDVNDLQEDIYGRIINMKTRKVVRFDLEEARKKLEDLDKKNGADESKLQIDRLVLGTINRVSERTLVRSNQVVSEMWQKYSKNDVKACLTRALSRLVCAPYRLQDQLLSLYALFMAYIHTFTSDEISAYFVESFLREFIDEIQTIQTLDDKKRENSVVFIAHLLNFYMNSYKVLRRQLWSAFSNELSKTSAALEVAVFCDLPRAKFLGESLLALQKGPPTGIDTSIIEHHLQLFYGLRKKNKVVSDAELGMSLDDILHADERGRWWIVGSAYQVANEGVSAANAVLSSQSTHPFSDDILKLARKAKMNTDVRRSVFCTVASSDDEDSAFEQLLRLSLKGQQEREIIYVLIAMLLGERTFNAFYPSLITRFCDFDKRFVLTTQYALWDRIREVATLKTRSRSRLADLIHYLISHEAISVTVLKVVEWGTLSAAVSSVIRRVFKLLSSCSIQKLRRIFGPIFVKDKNPLLSEGLRLFLSVNFPDSEVYRKVDEMFASVC